MSYTAPTMSTGEPDATESGQVRFGGGPSEKALPWQGPRWRPTRRHAGFGGRAGETGLPKGWYRALVRPYPSGSGGRRLGAGRQADREESWIPGREQDAQEANAGGRTATG